MTIGGPQIYLSGRALGPMALEARALGEQLEVKGKPVADTDLRLTARIRRPYPYEATLKLALADIRALLPDTAAAQGLNGSMNGVLTASGNLTEVEASRGQLHLDTLKLQRGEFRAESDGPWDVRFRGGRLSSEGLRLKGPETELSASGYLEEGAMDIAVSGAVDLRLLESFVPGLERTSGRLELLGSARGGYPTRSRRHRHLVDASSGRGQPLELRGLKGKLDYGESRICGATSRAGQRRPARSQPPATRWRRFRRPARGAAALDRVSVRVVEDAPCAATGERPLTGRPGPSSSPVTWTCSSSATGAPSVSTPLLARASPQRPRAKTPSELQLDVARLKGRGGGDNLARARIVGTCASREQPPSLIGAMEAGRGAGLLPGTTFTLTQGAVDFKDRRSLAGCSTSRRVTVREYLIRHALARPPSLRSCSPAGPASPKGHHLPPHPRGDLGTRPAATHDDRGWHRRRGALPGPRPAGQKFLPRNSVIRDLGFTSHALQRQRAGGADSAVESKFLTGLARPLSRVRGGRVPCRYRFDDRVAQISGTTCTTRVPIGRGRSQARWNIRRPLALALLLALRRPGRGVRPRRRAPVASVTADAWRRAAVPSDLRALVAVAPGQPLSARAVRRSIARLLHRSLLRRGGARRRGSRQAGGDLRARPVIRITRST
jgi:translocation and assembly module TamB